ncbi:MAG: 4Fe-4S binding protein [Candidatus Accumulibacter sp.]|nr:4Fe-4S binding protein [Accumulibacter sp.]
MEREQVIVFPQRNGGGVFAPERIKAFGDMLQRRQDRIRKLQWGIVAVYLFLLVTPACLPEADARAGVFASLARFTEALFWGVWWPSVILSMLILGQFWCGLLCPDGTITEFASRHGRGLKVPGWLRKPALPLLLFSLITLYEHLIDAFRSASATLLIIGGTSLLSLCTGLIFGRGKRVWCRFVCPGASIFSLLARCAVLHFKVDRVVWDAAPRPAPSGVDCPPLLDVRRLKSNEKCNMCGRCSGHRQAVALSWRAPGEEIAALEPDEVRGWEVAGILFVLIGLLYAVAHWSGGPWHRQLSAILRHWLGEAAFWQTEASRWLFAHGGARSDLIDAIAALASIVGMTLALGALVGAGLLLAARGQKKLAGALAYALIPLAGIGLALGAMEYSLSILASNGVDAWSILPWLRLTGLLTGLIWSLSLARRLLRHWRRYPERPIFVLPPFAAVGGLLAAAYQFAPIPA